MQVPGDVRAVLAAVVAAERQARQTARGYTYIDIFRTLSMTKINLVQWLFWFTLSLSFYGISFGVSALSGNLYLNIFLLAILELPVRFSTFWFNNKLGRKWTTLGFLALSAASAAGCLASHLAVTDDLDLQGQLVNGLCLAAKMFIGSAWSCAMIWNAELYPTVVRALGYGWASAGARVGGVAAPFLVDLEAAPTEAYALMAALLAACAVAALALPETRGASLADSLEPTPNASNTAKATGTEAKTEDGDRNIEANMNGNGHAIQGNGGVINSTFEKGSINGDI